jgi:hypothetical protein
MIMLAPPRISTSSAVSFGDHLDLPKPLIVDSGKPR